MQKRNYHLFINLLSLPILAFFLAISARIALAQVILCPLYDDANPVGEDEDPSLLELIPVDYDPDNPYVDFDHPTDPKAPQLSTLIAGNTRPRITGAYLIGNSDLPPDAPPGFANFVGFDAGDADIRLPASGYTIGQGIGGVIIYADSDSLVIKYTAGNNISYGYTLYLDRISVSADLLGAYQQAVAEGGELPAISHGAVLGKAINGNILVGIRDTGMWLDPRWLGDWWQGDGYPPVSGTLVCWRPEDEFVNGSCPNMDVGHLPSCGEGFILKVPGLFVNFLGNIVSLIAPKTENMPAWLKQWADYENKNPIERLHPPLESEEAEERFREKENKVAWTDSKTYYAWYDFDTKKGGTTKGNPDYPETSNNAIRPPYKSSSYLWGMMRPPDDRQVLGVSNSVAEEMPDEPINCALTISAIQTIDGDGNPLISFTVGGNGDVIQFNDINYEVFGPQGKIGCGGVLPQAGGVPTRVVCSPPAYPLKKGDLIKIVVFDHQVSPEQCPGNEIAVTILVGENTPDDGGVNNPPGCPIYGLASDPQQQPCVAGSCLAPQGVVHKVFQEIFDNLGNLIKKIHIGWATNAHTILFVPQLLYPKDLAGAYENGSGIYNSLLPPTDADYSPYPAIVGGNIHKINLGPFELKIPSTFTSVHKVPMIGRVQIQRTEKVLPYLDIPAN